MTTTWWSAGQAVRLTRRRGAAGVQRRQRGIEPGRRTTTTLRFLAAWALVLTVSPAIFAAELRQRPGRHLSDDPAVLQQVVRDLARARRELVEQVELLQADLAAAEHQAAELVERLQGSLAACEADLDEALSKAARLDQLNRDQLEILDQEVRFFRRANRWKRIGCTVGLAGAVNQTDAAAGIGLACGWRIAGP